MYKVSDSKKEMNKPKETLENPQSDKLKIGCIEVIPKPCVSLGKCHVLTTLAVTIKEKIQFPKAQVQAAVENQ